MTARPFHTLLVWLLALAQGAVLFVHPVGVVVCREADGSTHIEIPAADCCSPAAGPADGAAAGLERTPGAASRAAVADAACDEGPCEDAVIVYGWAAGSARARLAPPAAAAPVLWIHAAMTDALLTLEASGPCGSALADPGPPAQTALALGATVLRL